MEERFRGRETGERATAKRIEMKEKKRGSQSKGRREEETVGRAPRARNKAEKTGKPNCEKKRGLQGRESAI